MVGNSMCENSLSESNSEIDHPEIHLSGTLSHCNSRLGCLPGILVAGYQLDEVTKLQEKLVRNQKELLMVQKSHSQPPFGCIKPCN